MRRARLTGSQLVLGSAYGRHLRRPTFHERAALASVDEAVTLWLPQTLATRALLPQLFPPHGASAPGKGCMPVSLNKRLKEKARQEKQQDKAAKRQQRKIERNQRTPGNPDEDPDLAGIVPGPQPILDDSGMLGDGR